MCSVCVRVCIVRSCARRVQKPQQLSAIIVRLAANRNRPITARRVVSPAHFCPKDLPPPRADWMRVPFCSVSLLWRSDRAVVFSPEPKRLLGFTPGSRRPLGGADMLFKGSPQRGVFFSKMDPALGSQRQGRSRYSSFGEDLVGFSLAHSQFWWE